MTKQIPALNCPLYGVQLIEASAGTGKTWTLSALFARLIVQNPALSVRAAAKALEPQAIQPNSTGESTIRRLVGKFTVADVAK